MEEVYRNYINTMGANPVYEKYGHDSLTMPHEKTAPYRKVVGSRLMWQLGLMHQFIFYCFCACPAALIAQPLKVSSGHYEESPKREQTQRELIDKMAQQLSSLSRFHAYAKILRGKSGEQFVEKGKIMVAYIEPSVNSSKLERTSMSKDCYKPRDEIEKEIAERQAMWKRGLSSPSAEKKTEKKADTASKPPPTTTAG